MLQGSGIAGTGVVRRALFCCSKPSIVQGQPLQAASYHKRQELVRPLRSCPAIGKPVGEGRGLPTAFA